MAKTEHCNPVMICPPLTHVVFPTTMDSFAARTDQVPIRVRMAWGGVKSPVDAPPEDRHGGRSNRGGVERPRPAPSPEAPVRHRPAKKARPGRSVRSTDSTFYSPRTKLVFLKDVSAVHYRPGCSKPRRFYSSFLFQFIAVQNYENLTTLVQIRIENIGIVSVRRNVVTRSNAQKGKGKCIYMALFIVPGYLTLKAVRHGSHSFTCNYNNACLYLVSVHQMAPPQTEVVDI